MLVTITIMVSVDVDNGDDDDDGNYDNRGWVERICHSWLLQEKVTRI